MVATRSASGGIAFYVCNAPGPDGKSQTEIDRVLEEGIDDKNKVACVAMEYTPVTGANGGQPFTKFFTFGPDETLLLSINLDGRGEKFMPRLLRRLPWRLDLQRTLPRAGDGLALPRRRASCRSTPATYLFSSKSSLSEAAQSEAFFQLNQLVLATESRPEQRATSRLISGWYANGHVLDKEYRAAGLAAGRCAAGDGRRRPLLRGDGRHLLPYLPRVARRPARLGRHRPRTRPRASTAISAAARPTSPSMRPCRMR